MKIEMIKKFISDGENINFIFSVDNKKIQVEIGGTALSMLECTKYKKVKIQDEELEEIADNFDFVQFIKVICSRLNFNDNVYDNKIKISIYSGGVKVDIMSFKVCKKFCKN